MNKNNKETSQNKEAQQDTRKGYSILHIVLVIALIIIAILVTSLYFTLKKEKPETDKTNNKTDITISKDTKTDKDTNKNTEYQKTIDTIIENKVAEEDKIKRLKLGYEPALFYHVQKEVEDLIRFMDKEHDIISYDMDVDEDEISTVGSLHGTLDRKMETTIGYSLEYRQQRYDFINITKSGDWVTNAECAETSEFEPLIELSIENVAPSVNTSLISQFDTSKNIKREALILNGKNLSEIEDNITKSITPLTYNLGYKDIQLAKIVGYNKIRKRSDHPGNGTEYSIAYIQTSDETKLANEMSEKDFEFNTETLPLNINLDVYLKISPSETDDTVYYTLILNSKPDNKDKLTEEALRNIMKQLLESSYSKEQSYFYETDGKVILTTSEMSF